MEEEIFKTVKEFPNYEISTLGRIKTKSRKVRFLHSRTKEELFRQTRERFLKIQVNYLHGYEFVMLVNGKKRVIKNIHRLVAESFIPNPENFKTINHIDGNKLNNKPENLEWCTIQQNHEHATRTGLKAKGSKINTSQINEKMAHAIKYFLNKGLSHEELSIAFKVSTRLIEYISNDKTWTHVILNKK